MYSEKSTRHRWDKHGTSLWFKLFITFGGGLGDILHRIKDVSYLRILRDFKRVFPNTYVYAYIDSKVPELAKQLVETQPGIDEVVAVKSGGWNWTHVERFVLTRCMVDKAFHASRMPEGINNPDVVLRRTVNRIYAMIRFPRIRAISMDDFFQQTGLHEDDFEWELAQVVTTPEDEATATEMCAPLGAKDIVGIHPFTTNPQRCCYPHARWQGVIRDLLRRGKGVVLFGGPGEAERNGYGELLKDASVIDMTVECGMRVKAATVKACEGIMTIDGSMMHMAWLEAIPTVSITESYENDPPSFTTDPGGYHWAAIAKEPFADRIRVSQGASKELCPSVLVDRLEAIKDTKGVRKSKIWKDQRQ
jgi:ADP-heptose:LPS heptosyltransferase